MFSASALLLHRFAGRYAINDPHGEHADSDCDRYSTPFSARHPYQWFSFFRLGMPVFAGELMADNRELHLKEPYNVTRSRVALSYVECRCVLCVVRATTRFREM